MTTAHESSLETWKPLVDVSSYDLSPALRINERQALATLPHRSRITDRHMASIHEHCARLITPIEEVLRVANPGAIYRQRTVARQLLVEVLKRDQPYWTWRSDEWSAAIRDAVKDHRRAFHAVAYLIAGQRNLQGIVQSCDRRRFAHSVLGRDVVEATRQLVEKVLSTWGFGARGSLTLVGVTLYDLMLLCGSPRLDDLTSDVITEFYTSDLPERFRFGTRLVVRYLVAAGILATSPIPLDAMGRALRPSHVTATTEGAPPEWVDWCQRWRRTSTLAPKTRSAHYFQLMKVGRWLASEHPEWTDPGAWTRVHAAEWVAAVCSMLVGQWTRPGETAHVRDHLGAPLRPGTKVARISALRTFFRDCQEWGWIPIRFDPNRALATPRSIYALMGPDPRVIADDIWAKLLWAGLNLTPEDVGRSTRTGFYQYPFELVRAVAILWLFSGLRANEIVRLPVGCIRWQRDGAAPDGVESPDGHVVCLLDVPVGKTSAAFTKPVDRVVGDALAAWETLRPSQPLAVDLKTGGTVNYLFSVRGRRISLNFITRSVINALCRKANVPKSDARGAITSHRGRSTIATQLYNAREPMSLFELMAWLGHRSPRSTQAYAKITPTTLAKAYTDAGYFERNRRVIEVLLDRDAVRTGGAAAGVPWQYYDLGHGYCTYDFFSQCPHRMACARCDFYVPKQSAEGGLLEAKTNLQRMLVQIPLTDDERAAVEADHAAVDRLFERLADVPTPAGPTPRALAAPRLAVPLPVVPTPRSLPSDTPAEHPKEPSHADLLDANDQTQRAIATIPVTDDEKAAIEDDGAAVARLLEGLADVPTPP